MEWHGAQPVDGGSCAGYAAVSSVPNHPYGRQATAMDLKVFCGQSNVALAEAIGREITPLAGLPCIARAFPDGEPRVQIPDNVRGADVFLVQSTNQRLVGSAHEVGTAVGSNLEELLAMINAAKLASAGNITAVIPYFGCARQDRKVQPRTPITAQAICIALEAVGADRILTTDLHAGQITGFFRRPFDNLESLPILLRQMRRDLNLDFREVAFVSPDDGGVERCRETAKLVHCDRVTFVFKFKNQTDGTIEEMRVRDPDVVEGRDCLLIDDMVDTAGTLCGAAEALKRAGARRIIAACVHPVLSTKDGVRAAVRIMRSSIDRLYVTDTIPLGDRVTAGTESEKFHVVPVARLIAGAIHEIHRHGSVSGIFKSTCAEILQD